MPGYATHYPTAKEPTLYGNCGESLFERLLQYEHQQNDLSAEPTAFRDALQRAAELAREKRQKLAGAAARLHLATLDQKAGKLLAAGKQYAHLLEELHPTDCVLLYLQLLNHYSAWAVYSGEVALARWLLKSALNMLEQPLDEATAQLRQPYLFRNHLNLATLQVLSNQGKEAALHYRRAMGGIANQQTALLAGMAFLVFLDNYGFDKVSTQLLETLSKNATVIQPYQPEILRWQAQMAMRSNDLPRAAMKISKARSLQLSISPRLGEGQLLLTLGLYNLEAGQPAEAQACLEEALDFARRRGSVYNQLGCALALADALLRQNKLLETDQYLSLAARYLQKFSHHPMQIKYHRLRLEYLRRNGGGTTRSIAQQLQALLNEEAAVTRELNGHSAQQDIHWIVSRVRQLGEA